MTDQKKDGSSDEKRFNEALKRMLKTLPKPKQESAKRKDPKPEKP